MWNFWKKIQDAFRGQNPQFIGRPGESNNGLSSETESGTNVTVYATGTGTIDAEKIARSVGLRHTV